jgi:hypothetical protein
VMSTVNTRRARGAWYPSSSDRDGAEVG